MPDTAMHHRPGAHHAGFKGHIQGGIQQAVVLQHQPALTQGHDLRVGGRIVAANWPVPAFANHLVVMHQHSPDGHLTLIPRTLCESQRVAHPVFMGKFAV